MTKGKVEKISLNKLFYGDKRVKVTLTPMELILIRELAMDYCKSMTSYMKENHSSRLYHRIEKIMKKHDIPFSRFVSEEWENVFHIKIARQCLDCKLLGNRCMDWALLRNFKLKDKIGLCGVKEVRGT